MKRHANRGRVILAGFCVGALALLSSGNALAIPSHEDPEKATPMFSDVALLRYYSDSLDSILLKNLAEVEAKLGKMPLANVPPNLKTATGDFATSGTALAQMVVQIDRSLDKLSLYREQSRMDEAAELALEISANLTEARSKLDRVERAVVATGREFKAASAKDGSDLKSFYQDVQDRITRIRGMLDLFETSLSGLQSTTAGELPTQISLSLEPMVAFVGDNINLRGRLASGQEGLGGREVEILLNNSVYLTAKTDASGSYIGVLPVPYWYWPELDVQAIYYPRGSDKGVYIASLSPVVRLRVIFYPAQIEISPEAKAYPGRDTILSVRFDYGDAPLPAARKVELRFDDRLIAEVAALPEFNQKITIDPDTSVGKHVLTVSSAAAGRYAPAVSSAFLEVAKATPVLDMGLLPGLVLIPGGLNIKGRLYSELGPLNNAHIELVSGRSRVEFASQENGDFQTRIKLGMNLGIVGSQDLTIRVTPAEPWHAPLVITRPLLAVNVVNSVVIFLVLMVLAVYLPARLRRRVGAYVPRKAPAPVSPVLAQPTPLASKASNEGIPPEGQEDGEPRYQVLYWYHTATALLARAARGMLRPQQTLREFAQESNRVLGSAATHFMVLTRLLERVLYSDYQPSHEDAEKSRQLSISIKEKLKG
ncbi:MAG: DUF4129 domain-containing protein [Chloroflexi bacterium]|nr:DUF4129 domain-containing protein [Chloroflexota bacterium]